VRAGVYGVAPLLVGMAFGLTPEAGMLLVPAIGFLTGFGFAAFGVTVAAVAKTIDNFNYITSAVLTPMFLVAGTFFPVSNLPAGIRVVAEINPLYHCVQLVRDASLGNLGTADLGHTAVLIAFALLMWRLAIWQLGRRLID
jgi:lipooligosaccharide transport system permease protein